MQKDALIILNLGSPAPNDLPQLENFLFEFLSDKHILDIPKFLRIPLAKRISAKRAKSYAQKLKLSLKIAELENSEKPPLVFHTQNLAKKISEKMQSEVVAAYRYGGSMEAEIDKLRKKGAKNFFAIPAYAQNAYSTTASAREAFYKLKKPDENFYFKNSYFDDPNYISALANSLEKECHTQALWDAAIVSFHAIPMSQAKKTPYIKECEKTFSLLATSFSKFCEQQLKLEKKIPLHMAWQSKMGRCKRWTSPSIESTVKNLAQNGAKNIAVICPGFSCDCTETLIDIKTDLANFFEKCGGEKLQLIPCLNSADSHVEMFAKLFKNMLLQNAKKI